MVETYIIFYIFYIAEMQLSINISIKLIYFSRCSTDIFNIHILANISIYMKIPLLHLEKYYKITLFSTKVHKK